MHIAGLADPGRPVHVVPDWCGRTSSPARWLISPDFKALDRTHRGQKCTAIRRVIVPQQRLDAFGDRLIQRLKKNTLGDPDEESVRMGALASLDQKDDVTAAVNQLLNTNVSSAPAAAPNPSAQALAIGEPLLTHRRTVTEAGIVNFGCLSGDHFYMHFDDIAAKDSQFGQRIAHGYFLLSAAGLFVSPAPGPVLANYGLDTLRFINPVGTPQGVVVWDVQVKNQDDELVASYDILTLVAKKKGDA